MDAYTYHLQEPIMPPGVQVTISCNSAQAAKTAIYAAVRDAWEIHGEKNKRSHPHFPPETD